MAKSGADVEIEFLNRKISELERAKELVYEARMSASTSEPAAEKPKRGRKRKGDADRHSEQKHAKEFQ